MSKEVVERALADLVRRVAGIEDHLGEGRPRGWCAVAGQAGQDNFFEEAMRVSAKWRSKANTWKR
jgi:hypothetical protein